jgi:hypothetical protein
MPHARLTAILLDVLRTDGDLDTRDLVGLVEPAFPPSEPYWNVRRCVGMAIRDLAEKGLVEARGDHVAFRGRPAALAG